MSEKPRTSTVWRGATMRFAIYAQGTDAGAVTLDSETGVWSLEATDFETKASYSWTFTATDGAGNSSDQAVAISIEAEGGVTAGRYDDYDAGTAGNIFVAPAGDDTTGDGSVGSPYATAAKAASVIANGQTIRFRAGTYREAITITGKSNIRLASYGTEEAILTGANIVTGFAACTSGDQALVGDNYASIYKATISTSTLEHTSYHALLLSEDGEPLDLVQKRADMSDLFVLDNYQTFYKSDADPTVSIGTRTDRVVTTLTRGDTANSKDATGSTTVSNIVAINVGGTWNGDAFTGGTTYAPTTDYTLDGNSVSWAPGGSEPSSGTTYNIAYDREVADTITHASVLGAYTDTQLAAMAVAMHVSPNLIAVLKIASVSDGVITLETNTYEPDLSLGGQKYALLNILPEIAEGQWAYVDNGDGTLTLYVWPNDTANLTSGIEIAARKLALKVSGCSGVQIDGLKFSMTCATGGTEGRPLHVYQCENALVKQVEVFNYSHGSRGYGAIVIEDSNGAVAEHYTVRNGQSCAGVFMQGYSAANPTFDNRLKFGRHERTTQTPVRWFGQQRFCDYFWLDVACGAGAHANQHIAYQGCDKAVFFGGSVQDHVNGYATYQASSNIAWVNCALGIAQDGRALWDQVGDGQPEVGATNYIINCAAPHDPGRVSGYPSFGVGARLEDSNMVVENTVAPGIALRDESISTLTRNRNIVTKGDVAGTDTSADPLAVFYDASASMDTIPDSPVLSATAQDVSAHLAAIEEWVPDMDLRRDLLGRVWDPADPGVGPYGKEWPVKSDTTAPVLSGFSADEGDVSVSTNDIGGTLYWVRLADGAATPSAAQVKAGQDSTGAAAGASDSQEVSATGAQTFTVTGDASTTYKVCIVHEDRFSNISNVLTGSITLADDGAPSEWLVTSGGYLVDPSNVPAATTRITFRGKFKFPSVSGQFFPFTQESTGCDLRITNGTTIAANVEDSTGTAVISVANFTGASVTTDTWYDIVFDVDHVAQTAKLTLNGVDYTVAFSTAGTGSFQSNREVAFLGTTAGGNLVPTGTEFADLSVEFNGVLRKAISNDAATANADAWFHGTPFTQGA